MAPARSSSATWKTWLPSAVLAALLVPFPQATGAQGENEFAEQDTNRQVALGSPEWRRLRPGPWGLASGTVHCDGQRRGSAVILAVSEFGPQPSGLVLASAAHVLFDLALGQPFSDCHFDYLGLSQLPGYRGRIDLRSAHLGAFDPRESRDSPAFGRSDWVFLHVPEGIPAVSEEARVRPVDWRTLPRQGGAIAQQVNVRLLAWSDRHSNISLSQTCRVVASREDDLGGGAWPGQLLDDCASGQGASGGGMIAVVDGTGVVFGIRLGAHWNGLEFPPARFPQGPPDDAPWDVNGNTHFSRALDRKILAELTAFLTRIQAGEQDQPSAPVRN